MKRLYKELFSRLKWYQQAEYAILLFLAISTPLSWRVSIVGIILLILISIVKAIISRQAGNPALGKREKWALVAMIAFFSIYLASGFFSQNRAYGLQIAIGKFSFLILPVAALLSDTRYLSRLHLRTIFYTLFVTLAVTFLVCTVVAATKLIGGSTLNQVLDSHFFPTHHTYMALYLTVSMAFGYTEILRHLLPGKGKALPLWFLLTGELMLTLFAMAVNSRAGILVICLMAVVVVADIAFLTRQWKTALCTFLLLAVCGAGLYTLQPESRHRLTKTVQDLGEEYPEDARVDLVKYGLEVVDWDMDEGRWIFGLGEGDYIDHIYTRYAAHGYRGGGNSKGIMGTHNQYLETFLATGAIGLAIMLLMLLLPLFPLKPLFHTINGQPGHPADMRIVPAVVLPTLLTLATESMLGRQMGIIFIAYTYYLLILWKSKTSA